MTRTFNHPVVGTLTLSVHQLAVDGDLLLIAYTALRGSHSWEALRVMLEAPGPADD